MKSFKILFSVVCLSLAAMVPAAQAGMMSFSFDSTGSHDVNGTLTYDDATNGINNGTSLGHNITGISGFITGDGGGSIASLINNPNQPNPYGSSGYVIDNNVFLAGTILDLWGMFFKTADGSKWNLWGNGNSDYELHSYDARLDEHGSLSIKSIPEPQTLLLIGLGLIGMAFVVRRQQSSQTATAGLAI